MNKTKNEIHDVEVDGNTVRFVRKKKLENLHNLFKRMGMLD
jgi:hypothetical protein